MAVNQPLVNAYFAIQRQYRNMHAPKAGLMGDYANAVAKGALLDAATSLTEYMSDEDLLAIVDRGNGWENEILD